MICARLTSLSTVLKSAAFGLILAAFASASQAEAAGASLLKLRLNEHHGPQAVVLDLSAPGQASVTKENGTLVVHISGVDHQGAEVKADPANPYYSKVMLTPPDHGMSTLTFDGKRAFDAIAYSIEPDKYGGHRIVIQLKDHGGNLASIGTPHMAKPAMSRTAMAKPAKSCSGASYSTDPLMSAEQALASGDTACACSLIAGKYNDQSWNMRAMVVKATCERADGKDAQAKAILTRLLNFDPEFHRARLLLAEKELAMGNTKAARQHYQYVLDTDPPSDVVATIVEQMGRPKPALPKSPAMAKPAMAPEAKTSMAKPDHSEHKMAEPETAKPEMAKPMAHPPAMEKASGDWQAGGNVTPHPSH